MVNVEKIGLRFAFQNGVIKHAADFDGLRGSKKRPTDLLCPSCGDRVTVVLSPDEKMVEHFRHCPDSQCTYRAKGESALHLNAKIGLAKEMEKFHYASLIYQCGACTNWYPFLEINEYDSVKPECRLGNRRPDLSCLQGGETIGAAREAQKVIFENDSLAIGKFSLKQEKNMEAQQIQNAAINFVNEKLPRPSQAASHPFFCEDKDGSFAIVHVDDGIDTIRVRVDTESGDCKIMPRFSADHIRENEEEIEIVLIPCPICSHASGQLDGETCRECRGFGTIPVAKEQKIVIVL